VNGNGSPKSSVARQNASLAEQIATKYGIKVVWTMRAVDVPSEFRGPRDHGCDTRKRIVYFIEDPENWTSWTSGPEAFLHEVVHVIVHCPWGVEWTIDTTPEDFVLLQFERSLARALYSKENFRRVISWQRDTLVFMHNFDELSVYPEYYRSKLWKRGYQVARVLGILDAENKPTFQWPNWRALRPHRRSLTSFFQGDGNPYPTLE